MLSKNRSWTYGKWNKKTTRKNQEKIKKIKQKEKEKFKKKREKNIKDFGKIFEKNLKEYFKKNNVKNEVDYQNILDNFDNEQLDIYFKNYMYSIVNKCIKKRVNNSLFLFFILFCF